MTPERDDIEWRRCEQAPNYEVSSDGRVRRVIGPYNRSGEKVLRPSLVCGYKQVVLMVYGKRTTFRVSRLVATAFIGDPPSDRHEAAHWDGDRANNDRSNLRWATPTENSEDKLRHGTLHVRTWNSKLTAADAARIRELAQSGVSQRAIAREYGVQSAHISKIVRGLKWRQHLQDGH